MKFPLNQTVRIVASGERGTIIGRAEYAYAEPSYLIRYAHPQGNAVEKWWTESALEACQ
jgi:hypothetical protein